MIKLNAIEKRSFLLLKRVLTILNQKKKEGYVIIIDGKSLSNEETFLITENDDDIHVCILSRNDNIESKDMIFGKDYYGCWHDRNFSSRKFLRTIKIVDPSKCVTADKL